MTGYGNGSVYIPFNYLEERENTNYELTTRSVKALLDVDYRITKGLKASTQVGLQSVSYTHLRAHETRIGISVGGVWG